MYSTFAVHQQWASSFQSWDKISELFISHLKAIILKIIFAQCQK